jgi:hypothetical protein
VVTPNTHIREHLEDSILLAYLRRQQLEDALSLLIRQHVEIERCPRCLHKLDELAQVSATLEVLGQMPSYQHYPELSVAETYARVQGAASKRTSAQASPYPITDRQRPRKSALRLASVPVALALTLLFTMVIVFALWSGEPMLSRTSPGGLRTDPYNSTVTLRNHPTSTSNLALTATANANESATPVLRPTVTPVTGPYIEVCAMTAYNIAHWRLVICGHNFEVGSKVVLVALGKTPTLLPNVSVNKQGDFQVGWIIDNCANLPTTIFAYEKTNKTKLTEVTLQDIAFGHCPVPTATAGPSGG